jgi:PAS domain-containing protein
MDHDHFARKLTALQQRVAMLQQRGAGTAGMLEEALEELQSSLEELLVAEEELRQQNEALGVAHLEIQAARDRYADLYNFAPVGYFTLDANGAIIEANLTGAGLLGVDRSSLMGTPFTRFVVKRRSRAICHLSGPVGSK